MCETVPIPVLFNAWKHHAGFISDQISLLSGDYDVTRIKSNLKKIGNSTTDLYSGSLDVLEVCKYAMSNLKKRDLYDESVYISWINENTDNYREIELPDKSIWVLRIGTEPDRYLHIHPGRHTKNSKRVKANILKTAIATSIFTLIKKGNPFNVDMINEARAVLLDLHPIKFVTMNHELGQVIELFGKRLQFL